MAIQEELDYFESTKNFLISNLPGRKFVIEIEPSEQVTWFEAIGNAPTDDEEAYRESSGVAPEAKRKTRVGSVGICDVCQASSGFTEPEIHPLFHAYQTIRCKSCDAELVHSSKFVRLIVET